MNEAFKLTAASIISASATMLVAYFGFLSDSKNTEARTEIAIIQAQADRINSLERLIEEKAKTSNQLIKERDEKIANLSSKFQESVLKLSAVEAQLVMLRAEREGDVDELDVLQKYIDAQESVCWVKLVDKQDNGEIRFPNLMVNRAYEAKWGLSRYAYFGKTAFDQWPKEAAQGFHEHDLRSYREKQGYASAACFPSRLNPSVEHCTRSSHYYYPLENDDAELIGGCAIEISKAEAKKINPDIQ